MMGLRSVTLSKSDPLMHLLMPGSVNLWSPTILLSKGEVCLPTRLWYCCCVNIPPQIRMDASACQYMRPP